MIVNFSAGTYFFNGTGLTKYELDVFKYLPNNFYKKTRVKEINFDLDVIDLAYSTARTLCSYHLSHKELYFDVIASMLSYLNFIDSPNSDFLLSESRYKRLRDFSKGTRIGEMAQGINTLFVAKRLNFPYIVDFDLAKEKTRATLNIQTNGKSPDFVFMNASLSKIGLYESKGTMNGSASSKSGELSKAMVQINDITQPCFDYHLPICTKFENNRIPIKNKSSINYALIENECVAKKETKLLLKLHYASWFYLIGDFARVQSILNEGEVGAFQEDGDPIYELDLITDKRNPIYWVRKDFNLTFKSEQTKIFVHFFGLSTFLGKGEVKIGIYKKVIDNLVSSSEDNFNFQLPEEEINNLRKYPDGTLLYIDLENE